MYDVAIIGAGPTGVALSYFLSSNSFKVLVIEKDPKPGLRTICGEYLPDPTSLNLEGDIASSYLAFFRPFILHKMDKIGVELGSKLFRIAYSGYSIDRRAMIVDRLKESSETGAEVRTGEAFITASFERNSYVVRTTRGSYKARYLIGADGFNSRVAQLINGRNPMMCDDLALAFSTEISLGPEEPDTMRLIIDDGLAPGTYAWLIPRSEKSANVGLGVRLNMLERFNPRGALHKLLAKLGVKTDPDIRGRYVPAGGMVKSVYERGTFLAGDAAGMTIPSNGGGMHTGIIAAYLLAKSLAEGRPENYVARVDRFVRPMVSIGLTHRRAADFLMRTGLLWKTLDLIPGSMIEEVIRTEKGPYYPLLKLLSLLYPLVRGRVGSYPACRRALHTHNISGRDQTHLNTLKPPQWR